MEARPLRFQNLCVDVERERLGATDATLAHLCPNFFFMFFLSLFLFFCWRAIFFYQYLDKFLEYWVQRLFAVGFGQVSSPTVMLKIRYLDSNVFLLYIHKKQEWEPSRLLRIDF